MTGATGVVAYNDLVALGLLGVAGYASLVQNAGSR